MILRFLQPLSAEVCEFSLYPIHFPLDQIDSLTDLFSVGSSIFAMAAVLIALITYRGTARLTRLGHMHKLFGDYLLVRVNFATSSGAENWREDANINELMTIKLYVLEEMWLWLKQEFPQQHKEMMCADADAIRTTYLGQIKANDEDAKLGSTNPNKKLAKRLDGNTAFKGWVGTIVHHLAREDENDITSSSLRKNVRAYTPAFVDFCAKVSSVYDVSKCKDSPPGASTGGVVPPLVDALVPVTPGHKVDASKQS